MYPETIEFSASVPVKAFVWRVGRYPYHWHDALEIVYLLEGSAHVCLSAETHLLSEGMIAVANAGEIHRIYSNADNKMLFIQINQKWCEKILPDFAYTFFWCCSGYSNEKAQPCLYNKLKELVLSLAHDALLPLSAYRKNRATESTRALLACLTEHFDFIRTGPMTEALGERQFERFKKMYQYIANHNYQVTLKELTDLFNVNLSHMSRFISKQFGMTFQELLDYSKGVRAAKLLLSTNKRVIDIASESGFSDPKYLIKHFKTNYGYTPTQFRRAHRIDAGASSWHTQYEALSLELV